LDRIFDSTTTGDGPPSDDDGPRDTAPEQGWEIGKTVGGKYVLRRLLGKGGMGAVYEAEHVDLGKRVAVKVLRALQSGRGGTEGAARFRREARAASSVDSEHIVEVFDVGEDPELGLYMVMELLDGEDLGALLRRVGRLEPTLALAIARQTALALDKAHAAGVVHRDLKPENMFLRTRDVTVTVKLVDFGVAKLVRDAAERASAGGVTRAGAVLGTPSYMSPEQAMGLPTVDHRTDLYSLGAVLYEMLVGEPAFPQRATYEQTILAIMTETPPRVSSKVLVSPELDALVARLMAHEPEDRPAAAREVAALIDALEPRAAARRLSRPALDRGSFSDIPPPASPPRPRPPTAVTSAHGGDLAGAPTLLAPVPIQPWPFRSLGLAALAVVVAVGAWLALRGAGAAPSAGRVAAGTAPATSSPPSTPGSAPTASAPGAPSPAPSASALPAAASASAAPPPGSAGAPAGASVKPRSGGAAPKPSGQVGGAGITDEF
jgi:serine/threonine-protein kinase